MIERLDERVPGKVYILMEEGPGPESGFIEVEDSTGKSISLGRWVKVPSPWDGEVYALEIDDPRSSPARGEADRR